MGVVPGSVHPDKKAVVALCFHLQAPAHLPPCPGITGAASVPLCSLAFLPVPQDVMLDVMLAHPVDGIKLIETRGQDAAGAFGTLGKI